MKTYRFQRVCEKHEGAELELKYIYKDGAEKIIYTGKIKVMNAEKGIIEFLSPHTMSNIEESTIRAIMKLWANHDYS